ncbi:MAG: NADH dehydrogenase [Lachnospiraceae bacterium]|nr:NADH dehydrogenase [Candidatus Colinaster scatohippi]
MNDNILQTIDISGICGMGLHMQLDGFRLLYCAIATFMWIVSTVFSLEYMAHYKNKGRYYFFLILTYFATVGVFLSADFYTTFIFFEIMSLASYVWVAQDEKPASMRAAGTYLAVAVIGGLVMLMGIFLLYDMTGTVNFDALIGLSGNAGLLEGTGYDNADRRLWIAAICLLFGFGAKAGAFPMHIWLPKAHPVAPAPASALLSGILTKAGVFGVLVLTSYIFLGDSSWGAMILIIAVCTMFLGAVLALFSTDLKRTLACSSVSQIGFILTGVGMSGLLGEENGMALSGALLHMVNHSLLKLVLFSAAGVVFMNIHSLNLNDVRGFGRKKPLLNAIFLMGTLGIGGMPLWNGYISKTLIHESIVEYTHLLLEGHMTGIFSVMNMKTIEWLFLISGGFTVAYMTKLYVCIFIEKNADAAKQEAYDSKKKYMNPATCISLVTAAAILPVMGFTPGFTMNKMAEAAAGFLHASEMEAVKYFSFGNIKGAIISIVIGMALYFGIVRTLLMSRTSNEKKAGGESTTEADCKLYVDRWPKWLDLENLVYRPVVLYALPFVGGVVCRVLDSLVDWIVVMLRKTIYRDSPIIVELTEGNAITHMLGSIANGIAEFMRRHSAKKRKKEQVDYIHKFAVEYKAYSESRLIIARSMSFGLIMFCLGLLITVAYMFLKN